ncbi:GNAT family N-acetyltransferase [Streptomyces sp. TS71-3]|uniref:GNAT family N-acetyltransferase n=1 Tax=Streptomyces sp. TS71-3 TaxID=2733862 RepID=UPI002016C10D|nr:GNAT family N-acetyltransferase [Streptomyces sp. TS71-3]
MCTSAEEFAALGPEWDRLHGRCTPATPFQSHAWLHAWWGAYGAPRYPRGLRVILLRAADATLVGAAALLRTGGPVPALVPLGGAISDFSDVLLDDAWAERAAPVLAEALAQAAGGALIDFPEVRPGAAVERVYACWPGPRRSLPASVCLELPAVPMDELVARLPSSRGQRVRANLRKTAALGLERRAVPPEEVPGALRVLLDLHRTQWQGRGRKVTAEHLRPRFAAHLEQAVGAMAGRGEAAVTEFRLDGEVAAVDLTLVAPRLTGGYLYGADPRLRERKVDVTTMLLHSGTLHLADRPASSGSGRSGAPGAPGVLSMLRGDEPHKYHWRPERVVSRRLLLARGRGGVLLGAVACGAAGRGVAKEVLRARRSRTGAPA